MFLLIMFIWIPEAIYDSENYPTGSIAATCTSAYVVNVSSNAFTLILDLFQGSVSIYLLKVSQYTPNIKFCS